MLISSINYNTFIKINKLTSNTINSSIDLIQIYQMSL